LYDPTQGAVLVDGIDLRELDLIQYRQQLGVVLQEPFLFSGTIAENLRFAKPQATDDELSGIARMVGLDVVARRSPAGFEHPIREGGSGLSAGERQLISIGRALLADPSILIFVQQGTEAELIAVDGPFRRLADAHLLGTQ
jgi:ABC-type multidrug transport system fused ATPase/permease subunit